MTNHITTPVIEAVEPKHQCPVPNPNLQDEQNKAMYDKHVDSLSIKLPLATEYKIILDMAVMMMESDLNFLKDKLRELDKLKEEL